MAFWVLSVPWDPHRAHDCPRKPPAELAQDVGRARSGERQARPEQREELLTILEELRVLKEEGGFASDDDWDEVSQAFERTGTAQLC